MAAALEAVAVTELVSVELDDEAEGSGERDAVVDDEAPSIDEAAIGVGATEAAGAGVDADAVTGVG